MKKLILILLLTFGVMNAQEQASITVDANVQATLSLVANANVNFGNLSATSSPVLDPTGVAHADVGTQFSVGEFGITGTPGASISVGYTTSVTLGDETNTITFTPDVAGHESTQSLATTIINDAQVALGGTGAYTVWVGGSLGTLSNQVPGAYSSEAGNGTGSFTLTIEYF